jgi:hypothetical protein
MAGHRRVMDHQILAGILAANLGRIVVLPAEMVLNDFCLGYI